MWKRIDNLEKEQSPLAGFMLMRALSALEYETVRPEKAALEEALLCGGGLTI